MVHQYFDWGPESLNRSLKGQFITKSKPLPVVLFIHLDWDVASSLSLLQQHPASDWSLYTQPPLEASHNNHSLLPFATQQVQCFAQRHTERITTEWLITVWDSFPYLPHEPPPSPPGPALSPGSSSSSFHVWTGSTAMCLQGVPQVLMGTGTMTPLNARFGRMAR